MNTFVSFVVHRWQKLDIASIDKLALLMDFSVGVFVSYIRFIGITAGLCFLINTPEMIAYRQIVIAHQSFYFACLLFDGLFVYQYLVPTIKRKTAQ